MSTHRQRMLMALRGEMPDLLPYVPRIDLWYNANTAYDTLPKKHKGKTQDEISRDEGWALHKIVPEYLKETPTGPLHRALGLYSVKEFVFDVQFAPEVEIEVVREGDYTTVRYHTPVGSIQTRTKYSDEMKHAGASMTWVEEHPLKERSDYKPLGYIFETMKLVPTYERFQKWKEYIGEDGVAGTQVGGACSPMHHIQKDFLDATAFYFHYNDYQKEMRELAESVGNYFEQALKIIADSPAEMVMWGANVDDMLTYPTYFEKEITPWLRRASEVLKSRGKIVVVHCDGENLGLMDLIRDSGIDCAEAICPAPMTKVTIDEYYRRWADKLTIFGGIPSDLVLAESTTDDEFEAYLDHLFKVVAPGRRMILGIADTTPPGAVFDRLIRIGERVLREGRLPLTGSAPKTAAPAPTEAKPAAASAETVATDYSAVKDDIVKGRHKEIGAHIQALLDRGVSAHDILNRAMLDTMQAIGAKFSTGEVFIPQVLLSARAMNEGLKTLEPHFALNKRETLGKVVVGTVHGDFHDIGKNMVITMLRGVGFEVKDLGINLMPADFVKGVKEFEPDIVGLSALLTTSMFEMSNVIEALKASGLRDRVKVIVGGAPVNAKFANDIGADGHAPDAGQAVDLAKRLIAEQAKKEPVTASS